MKKIIICPFIYNLSEKDLRDKLNISYKFLTPRTDMIEIPAVSPHNIIASRFSTFLFEARNGVAA